MHVTSNNYNKNKTLYACSEHKMKEKEKTNLIKMTLMKFQNTLACIFLNNQFLMISVSNNTLMLHLLIIVSVFQRGILQVGLNHVSSSVGGVVGKVELLT